MRNKSVDFCQLSLHATPDESPGYLLWRVSTQWRSAIEIILKPLDLTHPQFVILTTTAWLTKNGDLINQAEVGKAAGLDPNTTSQILRVLQAKNFIKRIRSIDERSKSPVLTTKGSKILEEALPAVEQEDAKFFAVLKAKECDATIKIFQKLINKQSVSPV